MCLILSSIIIYTDGSRHIQEYVEYVRYGIRVFVKLKKLKKSGKNSVWVTEGVWVCGCVGQAPTRISFFFNIVFFCVFCVFYSLYMFQKK